MALTAKALTTVKAVKDELGISLADTSKNRILQRYINVVSEEIEQFLDRPLQFVAGVVEKLPGFGTESIFVSRTPVITLTQIKIKDSILSSNEYKLILIEGRDNVGEIYRGTGWPWSVRLGAGITTDPVPGTEDQEIEVTYDGGYVLPKDGPAAGSNVDLPSDIEQACIDAVVTRFRNKGVDRGVVAESLMSASVKYDRGAGNTSGSSNLPDEVERSLMKYRRLID